jgi:hypothetical protein
MRSVHFLLLSTLAFAPVALGAQEAPAVATPAWALQPPAQEPSTLLGVGIATSSSLQTAISRAQVGARLQIAQQIKVRVESMQERIRQEVTGPECNDLVEEFTEVTKSFVDETLVGTKVREQVVQSRGEGVRVYVLMELPQGVVAKAVVDKVAAKTELFAAVRKTQLFAELESEIQKMAETPERKP